MAGHGFSRLVTTRGRQSLQEESEPASPSMAREIEQPHDDHHGDELGDDPVAHEPVRPLLGEVSAHPQRGNSPDEDDEDDRNGDGDENFSVHGADAWAMAGEAPGTGFGAHPAAFPASSRKRVDALDNLSLQTG